MGTTKEEAEANERPRVCIFDKSQLSDWVERSSNLYSRFSTICKECASIYVSNFDRINQETINYVRSPEAKDWKCIGCDTELQKVELRREVARLLDFIRLSPTTQLVSVMQCPGCGTNSTEWMEPVMQRQD